jgi:hypothetical protein
MTSIGTRYTTEHVVRRDDRAGVYEELNSPLTARSDGYVQALLLAKPKPSLVAVLMAYLVRKQ